MAIGPQGDYHVGHPSHGCAGAVAVLGMLQHSHVAEVRALAASTCLCASRDNWEQGNALQAEQSIQVRFTSTAGQKHSSCELKGRDHAEMGQPASVCLPVVWMAPLLASHLGGMQCNPTVHMHVLWPTCCSRQACTVWWEQLWIVRLPQEQAWQDTAQDCHCCFSRTLSKPVMPIANTSRDIPLLQGHCHTRQALSGGNVSMPACICSTHSSSALCVLDADKSAIGLVIKSRILLMVGSCLNSHPCCPCAERFSLLALFQKSWHGRSTWHHSLTCCSLIIDAK